MTSHITITYDELAALPIERLERYIPQQYRFFFNEQPGVAPYRLLAFLSTCFTGQTLVEVGVHNGWGSLALGWNPANRVVGYDVDLSTLDPMIADIPNLLFKEGLADQLDPDTVLSAPLIHLDTLHDGVYETAFVAFLTANGYKGRLLCDDIHLNAQMNAFWAAITLPKHDLSAVGHSTGTGMVCFD